MVCHHFHRKELEYKSQAECQSVLDLGGQRSRNGNPPQRTLLGNLSAPSGSLSPQTNLSVNIGIPFNQPSQTDPVSSNKPTSFPNTYLLRPESLNPLANGFLSIFRRVICEYDQRNYYLQIQLSNTQNDSPDRIKPTVE